MAHLDQLKISNRVVAAARPRRKIDPLVYRRKKLIANIEEQVELVNLSIAGKPLELPRKRGHDVVAVRPRVWWTVEPDGQVFTQIRYNKMAMNIAGRGNTIQADDLEELVEVYRTVIEAARAGELDNSIELAVHRSSP